MLFLDCGLRVAELADIKLDDLDVDTGTIVIRRGKGGKGRVVHIGSKAQKALWRYLSIYRRGNSDSLFLGAGGQPLSKVGLQTMIERLGARTEVKVHPHKLRHTFAISYLRNGGDIFSLKYLWGIAAWLWLSTTCRALMLRMLLMLIKGLAPWITYSCQSPKLK